MYSFAANPEKLARAIKIAGPNASEEKVKEVYVSLKGLLIEDKPEIVVEKKSVFVRRKKKNA